MIFLAVNYFTTYILPFFFVLSVLVFFHELGHFLFAKLLGIRVERFSIGFPPRLFGKKIGDTDYCVGAVLFGGFVKMSGMIDESLDKEGIKGEPWEFMSKPIWVRAVTIAAGPVFNVLLTVILFGVFFKINGIPETRSPSVRVMENMPAKKAGLQDGDIILRINNSIIEGWEDCVEAVSTSPGKPLQVEYQRAGKLQMVSVTPDSVKDNQKTVGKIGIMPLPPPTTRPSGVVPYLSAAAGHTWWLTQKFFVWMKSIFTGKRSVKDSLGGPVRIAEIAGESAKSGFDALLEFMAVLSLNLAILNALPIPVLDGGHLLLLGIESVLRRPLSIRFRTSVQQVGMALILALMMFVIFNDLSRFF